MQDKTTHKNHRKNKKNGSNHEGHSNHHKMMIRDFRKRFWISLAATLPVLLLSPMIQNLLNFQLGINNAQYFLFGLSAGIYFYGGWPFLKGLVNEVRKKQPGMMTLIAVAITVAFGYSSATTFGLEGKKFFWELATLIDIMLLGHWIEMKSVSKASGALQSLVELIPAEAHKLDNGQSKDVKIGSLREGDIVLVKPGEKIPVDGEITEGEGSVNESMVTGESEPVKKKPGEKVTGGTINGSIPFKIKTEQVGEDAYLSKVIKMVEEAQNEKSKTQLLADKIAFWLTVTAITIGIGTLAVWLITGKPFVFALERMASVMVITCPHALGLAVPLVVAISTSISAANGLIIRNRTAFENSRKITLVAFDKTGTLTWGEFGVTRYNTLDEKTKKQEILQLAGSLESESEHPLAQGIINKMKEEEIQKKKTQNVESIAGKGIEGKVDGKEIKIVSPAFLEENGMNIPEEAKEGSHETVVYVISENTVKGYIALSDEIREDSYDAVQHLQEKGIKVIMMTGDNEKVAGSVSNELKLDGYYASLLPDQKLEKIKEFQKQGEFVAMTGDGVNDAPALAKANIGIAVGSGTDVAAETADIILAKSNPKHITALIEFGESTHKKMIQNFIWASGYNVVAIPLAAGVLYSAGILISPALGALLMSLSTVVVAINAQLLKRNLKLSH